MKLTKAIELNKDSEKSLRDNKFIDHANAIKIGNEAIERLQRLRSDKHCLPSKLLPSETEE